ncbi:YkvI family membrane protein [Haladaptatus halobius]|uniref:YkvI family membrane protein n=1 Tax=Haladaptatus halobius TaxID=2884875 RepID=UPI001D09E1A4|nr:hypothetical protein [Haladaptatus halobius]
MALFSKDFHKMRIKTLISNTHVLWVMFARLTETRIGRIIIPAIVFQSVSIGGGFSTGREVVEYVAKYGALGSVSILTYFTALAICGALIYEFSRKFNLYDYKSLMKNLIWHGWPIFELIYVILAVVIIAVVASAGGNLMNQILGVPVFVANVLLIGFIFFVLYFGRGAIERFSVIGTTFIYAVYITMFAYVLINNGGQALEVLRSGSTAYVDKPSISAAMESALIYAGYSLIGFIPPLFLIDRMESRSEAVLSGVLSAFMLAIPLALSYLSLLAYYPNERVMGASVPWLAMLGSPVLLVLYGVAIGWTLTESGVGFVHSITERIDENIRESDYRFFATRDGLSAFERGSVGLLILLSAIWLSRIGIISLVSEVYPILAVLFTAVLVLPLLTVGLYRLSNPTWKQEFWQGWRSDSQSRAADIEQVE